MNMYIGGIATPCRVHKIALLSTLHALPILQYQLPIILREAQYVGKRRVRQMKRQ